MKKTRIALFSVGLVIFCLTGPLPSGLQLVQAANTEKTVNWDVAIDCRTWRFNHGIAFTDFGRGDGFIANGKMFRAGTLSPGNQPNDPNAPGSIGNWIEHGTMAATMTEITAGKRPAFVATWFHLLDGGDTVVAAGPHPDMGPMAVVGGMGDFSGASGEIDVEIIGTNSTGCPNMRLTVRLKKQAPK